MQRAESRFHATAEVREQMVAAGLCGLAGPWGVLVAADAGTAHTDVSSSTGSPAAAAVLTVGHQVGAAALATGLSRSAGRLRPTAALPVSAALSFVAGGFALATVLDARS